MDFELSEDQATIRRAVAELAAKFDDQYWMEKDAAHEFPTEFYQAFADGGWLGITTPEEYGGHGFGITEAALLLEEVSASGAGMNGASSMHLSIFGMHPVILHGSEEMKRENLPRIVSGDLHVCFGVTEPGAGLDTTRITTFARRDGSDYVVNGRKVWISKAMESEKVLLLTRTRRFEDVEKKTDGLTLFLTDLDRDHVDIRPISMNQGLQFPLADSLARLDAAELALRKATWLYDNGKPCAREANTAKYLCADAGFDAADRALQTHGGMGYSEEYHVARYFREARLLKIAPLSQEMVLNYLGSHVLGLPRSY